jgi:histidine phosphotransferase ChpT
MNLSVDLRVVELLCARLCHELVSPIGAINNGVELILEEDQEFAKDALKLIGESARKAWLSLMFYRFAYGSTPGAMNGAGAKAREVAVGLFESGRVRCEWSEAVTSLPGAWQKLACNTLVVAAEALARGGTVQVRPASGGATGIEVTAEGETINLSAELKVALSDKASVDALTARTVHGYFTAQLAVALGTRLTVSLPQPNRAVFSAVAAP